MLKANKMSLKNIQQMIMEINERMDMIRDELKKQNKNSVNKEILFLLDKRDDLKNEITRRINGRS